VNHKRDFYAAIKSALTHIHKQNENTLQLCMDDWTLYKQPTISAQKSKTD